MKYLIIIIVSVHSLYANGIVINEWQPMPVLGEPEWVELYNSDSLNKYYSNNLTLSDSKNTIVLPHFILEKNSYCIITKDTIALKKIKNIPEDCLLIQQAMPALNNTVDNIIIRNNGSIVDSVWYTLKQGKKGISFERKKSNKVFTVFNYGISVSIDSSTCGYLNSISPMKDDISVDSLYIIDNRLHIEYSNEYESTIKSILCTIIISKDTFSCFIDDLLTIEKKVFLYLLSDQYLDSGWHILKIELIHSEKDPRMYNNSKSLEYFTPFKTKECSINEVYVSNSRSIDQSDFIELYTHYDNVDLRGYYLSIDSVIYDLFIKSDRCDSKYYVIENRKDSLCNSINTNKYLDLSNSKGIIILYNPNNMIVDSFTYSSMYQLRDIDNQDNRSYERYYDSLSMEYKWSSSVSITRGTPGYNNSLNNKKSPSFNISYDIYKYNYVNSKYSINLHSPYRFGIYSAFLYSRTLEFIGVVVESEYITYQNNINIHIDNKLNILPDGYIMVHQVKDLYTNEILTQIKPFIIRY